MWGKLFDVETNSVIINCILSIFTVFGLLALIVLGIYGCCELFVFIFMNHNATILFKGIVSLSVAIGIPIGLSVTFDAP